jgi:hypothetical protein
MKVMLNAWMDPCAEHPQAAPGIVGLLPAQQCAISTNTQAAAVFTMSSSASADFCRNLQRVGYLMHRYRLQQFPTHFADLISSG